MAVSLSFYFNFNVITFRLVQACYWEDTAVNRTGIRLGQLCRSILENENVRAQAFPLLLWKENISKTAFCQCPS